MSFIFDVVLLMAVFTLMLRVGMDEAHIDKLEKQIIEFVEFQEGKESVK